MEALIAGLGIAAGAGWGVAGGLAVALWVALSQTSRPRPPAHTQEADVEFPNFGTSYSSPHQRRA